MADNFAYTYHDVIIYPYPNPAITQILFDPRLRKVVADYTYKIEATYRQKLLPRTTSKRKANGGRHLVDTIGHYIGPGGYKNDRWIGEVTVGDGASNPYGAADEFGRNAFNPYEGAHQLRESLYTHLPFKT